MTINQTFDYYDIVNKPKEPSFAEEHIPTFLNIARKLGYFQQTPTPTVEQKIYPREMAINMPKIPYQAGRDEKTPRPLIYVFDRVEEIIDHIGLSPGQQRVLQLNFDNSSYRDFISDIPYQEDGSLFGNYYFQTIALGNYVSERFQQKGLGTKISIGTNKKLEFTFQKI